MTRPYDAQAGLARLAQRVRGSLRTELPALFALTDPVRTPDPLAFASQLAPGSGLVYRHFGAPERFHIGLALAELAHAHGLYLFVSNDLALADAIGAHGVHWPERDLAQAWARRLRGDRRPFTASVHSPAAGLRAARAGIDGVFHSTVFASQSATARRPHGIHAAAALARHVDTAVYPLGGVNADTGRRLIGLGFAGFCCVGALSRD
ncbi:thiamine phosphate synthase [Maricaulis salignorans]|uniref:thiamine phosphate synthase n=1 Tax=Maricaulis salignorans TaxID=144026 RepID=UPI003A8D09B9